jgi:DNA (cytosine-5)-methyltransferase 1
MRRIQDYMTITEAAEFLGVSVNTLRNWDRVGKLTAARNPMNRYRLYQKADLEALLHRLSQSASTTKARRR